MTRVLRKKQRHGHWDTEITKYENRKVTEWYTNKPRNIKHCPQHQSKEKGLEEILPYRLQREHGPASTFMWGFLRNPVCGNCAHSPTKLMHMVISNIQVLAPESVILADICSVIYISGKNSIAFQFTFG